MIFQEGGQNLTDGSCWLAECHLLSRLVECEIVQVQGRVYWPRTGTLGDEELTVDRLRNWILKMCMFKLVQDTCSNPCKFVIRSRMFHIGKTLHLGDSTEFPVPVSPTSLPTDSPKVFCFLGCNPKYHWYWKTTSNQIQFLGQFPDPSAKNSHSSCSSTFKIFQDLNN